MENKEVPPIPENPLVLHLHQRRMRLVLGRNRRGVESGEKYRRDKILLQPVSDDFFIDTMHMV